MVLKFTHNADLLNLLLNIPDLVFLNVVNVNLYIIFIAIIL
jgi:hypothetical protein